MTVFDDWRQIDPPKIFRFYDYTANAVWNGSPYYRQGRKVSYDEGKTWEI